MKESAGGRARGIAFFALFAGGASIAFSPIFVRLSDVGPMTSAFWRVALAAPVLAAWAFSSRRRARAGRSPPQPVILAGFFFAGDLAFWHLSIAYTSVANASLLANFAPVFVTLGAWLIFRLRATAKFLFALVMSLAGAMLLVGPNFALGGKPLVGDLFGMVTAAFYGSYMLAIKQARDSGSTAGVMAASTSITAAALLPLAMAAEPVMLPATASGWMPLIGLAFVAQVAGQSLIAYAMAHLPAALSALSLLIQPLLAAIYAWIILGEAMSPAQLAGGAVVLAGIYLASRSG